MASLEDTTKPTAETADKAAAETEQIIKATEPDKAPPLFLNLYRGITLVICLASLFTGVDASNARAPQTSYLFENQRSLVSGPVQRATSNTFIYHLHIGHTGGSTLKVNHQMWAPNHISCNRAFHIRSYGLFYRVQSLFEPSAQAQREQCGNLSSTPELCQNLTMAYPCSIMSYEGKYEEVMQLLPMGRLTSIVCFFREPLLRVVGAAMHFAGKNGKPELQELIKDEKFITSFCNDGVKHLADNVTTAVERMRTFFFVGITERYDESIQMLAWQMEVSFNLKKGIIATNTHNYDGTMLDYSVLKKIITSQCLDDSLLYASALVEFNGRWEKTKELLT